MQCRSLYTPCPGGEKDTGSAQHAHVEHLQTAPVITSSPVQQAAQPGQLQGTQVVEQTPVCGPARQPAQLPDPVGQTTGVWQEYQNCWAWAGGGPNRLAIEINTPTKMAPVAAIRESMIARRFMVLPPLQRPDPAMLNCLIDSK